MCSQSANQLVMLGVIVSKLIPRVARGKSGLYCIPTQQRLFLLEAKSRLIKQHYCRRSIDRQIDVLFHIPAYLIQNLIKGSFAPSHHFCLFKWSCQIDEILCLPWCPCDCGCFHKLEETCFMQYKQNICMRIPYCALSKQSKRGIYNSDKESASQRLEVGRLHWWFSDS